MEKIFKPISHSTWIQQVEKDLKGQSVESKDWIVEQGIHISSFDETTSLKLNSNENPLSTNDIDNSWQIIESFEGYHTNELNSTILNSLNYGSQGILLSSTLLNDIVSLKLYLDNISLDYIHIGFCANTLDQLNEELAELLIEDNVELKTFLNASRFEWSGKINHENTSQYLKTIEQFERNESPNIWISISYKKEQSVSEELAQILLQLNIWEEAAKSNNLNFENLFKNTCISIELEDRYFVNIAKIRALKIMLLNWSNMYFGHFVDQPKIRAVVKEIDSEDQNISYIPMTWKAMSAVISGVDQLQIIPLNNDVDSRRNTRNIHHLLSEESYLDKVIDPAGGSYFLEKTTKAIANKSWELFYNNIETYAS